MAEPWWIYPERSDEPEILDDPNLEGNDLQKNLSDLTRVNKLLGGYKILQNGLSVLMQKRSRPIIYVVDIGCGGGDSLIFMADLARRKGWNMQFTGLDFSPAAVNIARKNTAKYPEIEIRHLNAFSPEVSDVKADIYTLNLVLHHFGNQDIIRLISSLNNRADILINDLQRNRIAYFLFMIFSRIFGFSYISRHDGLLSVRKSFSRNDWKMMLAKTGITEARVTWSWAFRYLVLIKSSINN